MCNLQSFDSCLAFLSLSVEMYLLDDPALFTELCALDF